MTNLASAGQGDILLAQLDRFGNWQWASRAGGSQRDAALAVAVDETGAAFVPAISRALASSMG